MLRREKGFTLIELLIVVAIIGIIAAIAVPNFLTAIQRSKRNRTAADMRAIGTALGSYQVDANQFPVAVANMMPGYFAGSTNDGWGQGLTYATAGTPPQSYTVGSAGKPGTGDEFCSNLSFFNGQFTGPSTLL